MLTDQVEQPPGARTLPGWAARMMSIEWLGQTAASLCWIASVFVHGLTSAGDYLQLSAASAWLVANVATVVSRGRA